MLQYANSLGEHPCTLLVMCNTDYSACSGFVYDSNPAGITVYDTQGKIYNNAGAASTIDKSGIVWNYQDYWVNTTTYAGYRGHVWFWLKTAPNKYPFYIKMDYQHTWTNATYSSAGFTWTPGSAPQINLQFTTTPSQFKSANQITLSSWPTLN